MTNKFSLSINEAVKYSGIGRTKLYELIKTGQITKRKLGTKTLILTDELSSFICALPKI